MKFLRFIALKPYGNTLCAPSAQMWIAAVSVCVGIMAATEAVAWGYVGHFLGIGWLAKAIGVVTGSIAFIVVWTLDSTFVTLDLRRKEYERRLAGLKQQPLHSTRWQNLVRTFRGAGAGLITRLLLAAGSLAVSAPFLTQLLFSKDIDRVLDAEFATRRAAVRRQIENAQNTEIATQAARLDQLRRQLVAETAGQGPSKRYGYGPTAKALERDVADAEKQLAATRSASAERLRSFDALTPEQITEKYGIASNRHALQTRTAALEEVKKQPGFLRSEITIAAFLFGIFLAIVVLKAFEPHAAEIYYSEFCQDRYACYRRGDYDSLLQPHEKATAGGDMTPLRFDEWLEGDYAAHEERNRRETLRAAILVQLKNDEQGVGVIRQSAQNDLIGPMNDEDAVRAEIAALEEDNERLKSELAHADQQIAMHRRSIEDLDKAIQYPKAVGGPGRYARALDTLEEWNRGLGTHEETARQLRLKIKLNSDKISSRQAYADLLKREVEKRAQTLTSAETEIAAARQRALEALKQL